MKKFLAVFDGFKMSESTLEYSLQFAKASGAHLVGVFLDDFIYRSYSVYDVVTAHEQYEKVMKELDAKDKEKRDEAARQFQVACVRSDVAFSLHRDKSIALQELKQESMFADLVIINENETFTRFKEQPPTRFIKDLLGDVQCPVLLVPADFKPVDKITLLYDGRPTSLYAIKMFSYLFGNLNGLDVEVFHVKDKAQDSLRLAGNKLMREFIGRHFPKAQYTIIKGTAEDLVVDHLKNHAENELVVLGAYQRSELSRLFKTSMADILMRELDTPLFVAHNK